MSEKKMYDPIEERLNFLKLVEIDGKKVLDIGANKAKMSRIMAKNFDCDITCIDPSQEKIDISKSIVKNEGINDKIKFIKADARETEFPDKSFDISLCFSLLHHIDFKDREKVIKELFRITKDTVLIADLHEKGAKTFDQYIHPKENHTALLVDFKKLYPVLDNLAQNIEAKETEIIQIFICKPRSTKMN